jgi:hypothetical protein
MWRVEGGGWMEDRVKEVVRVCLEGVGGGERKMRGVVGERSVHTHLPVSRGVLLPQLSPIGVQALQPTTRALFVTPARDCCGVSSPHCLPVVAKSQLQPQLEEVDRRKWERWNPAAPHCCCFPCTSGRTANPRTPAPAYTVLQMRAKRTVA